MERAIALPCGCWFNCVLINAQLYSDPATGAGRAEELGQRWDGGSG
jgi:hypothetical protein